MNYLSKTLNVSLAFCLMLFSCSFGFAASDEKDKTLSPYFFVKSDNPTVDQLPLHSTSAAVDIAGVIADVTVTQVYKNEGKSTLEAIYVFPASTKAAVYGMKMIIGNRTITAEIKERQQARVEYEAAKAAGQSASLLEQERPNVFQMNVANIQPGDEIEVILQYTELLVPNEGIYEFVYPTVVGPRYSNQKAAEAPENDGFVETPYLKEGMLSPCAFDISINLAAGLPIQEITCPSHEVNIAYEKLSEASISLKGSEEHGGNRDYILQYGLAGGKIQSGLILYEHGDENFFLAMVQPPKRVTTDVIPPREYVFIVDVSGSMGGFPLDISKKLLRDLIVNLRPTDKFNVLLFAGTSGAMAEESMFATEENVQKAINTIDNTRGGGGTELLGALNKAFYMKTDPDMARSFVVVTDGYVNVEKESYDLIRNNLNKANLFSFGIGSGVNRYIIEGMARVGMSEPLIITSPANAHAQAEKFRKYIQSPVLTHIEAKYSDFEVYDVEPVSIPDVLAERPIILFGKWKGDPKGTITLTGHSGSSPYKTVLKVGEVRPSKKNSALRSLWAREKIAMLDDYNKLSMDDARVKEVTALGLKYNLMTAYTSFLAVDNRVVKQNGKPVTVKQPSPLPQGVSNAAVGFDLSIEGLVRREKNVEKGISSQVTLGNVSSNISVRAFAEFKRQLKAKVQSLAMVGNLAKGTLLELELILDRNGTVISVTMNGRSLTASQQKALEKAILKWQFRDLQLSKTTSVHFPITIAQ